MNSRTALVIAALLGSLAGPAAARGAEAADKEESVKGYTMPYFFAGIGVLAIVIAACRPSNRKHEVPELSDE